MECKREDAFLILGKWRDESRLLAAALSFSSFIASLRGKITSLSEDEVRIKSEDNTSEVAVTLDRVLRFGYAEPRRESREREDFVSGLVLFFSEPNPDDSEFDFFTLTEFTDAT